jgi:mannose-6-phosphate isomerase-like protein (cupin superfamily)
MVVNHQNSQRYSGGENCAGWHLLRTPGLSIIQERVPPGASEVRHSHLVAQQFFYILSGVARMEIDGQSYTLQAGDGIHIPPQTPHQFRNQSDAEGVFLVISQPPSHGDRLNE